MASDAMHNPAAAMSGSVMLSAYIYIDAKEGWQCRWLRETETLDDLARRVVTSRNYMETAQDSDLAVIEEIIGAVAARLTELKATGEIEPCGKCPLCRAVDEAEAITRN